MMLNLIKNFFADRESKKGIALSILVASVCLTPWVAGQDTPGERSSVDKNCGGLHAGIRAELVRRDPPYTEPPFVMLSFVLLNDGENSVNSAEQGWMIVVDGKELGDSGWIFGNGPSPVGGWGILEPGESYEFAKGLPISKYFSEDREYKVSWKGKGFQSSTITVKVTPER